MKSSAAELMKRYNTLAEQLDDLGQRVVRVQEIEIKMSSFNMALKEANDVSHQLKQAEDKIKEKRPILIKCKRLREQSTKLKSAYYELQQTYSQREKHLVELTHKLRGYFIASRCLVDMQLPASIRIASGMQPRMLRRARVRQLVPLAYRKVRLDDVTEHLEKDIADMEEQKAAFENSIEGCKFTEEEADKALSRIPELERLTRHHHLLYGSAIAELDKIREAEHDYVDLKDYYARILKLYNGLERDLIQINSDIAFLEQDELTKKYQENQPIVLN
mmetsp:Transcript_8023/g.8866  ORF Transcript_8023/g.8866 Transcript_8023/m.8866 type:complete len:276 (-) Transcript_8023:67-894(-)